MVSYKNLVSRLTNWSLTPTQFLVPLMIVAVLMNGYLLLRNPNMGGDAMYYHSAVHNFFSGKGWVNFQGVWDKHEPGYGLLSYLIFLFIRDIEYSGMLVSAIAYLLIIPTVFYSVNFIFGKQSAMLAAFLVTFWPTLLTYSYVNLTDCVYTFVLFLGFYLYIRVLMDKQDILRSILLGLVLGFAYLIREPESLFVASLVILSLFALAFKNWMLGKGIGKYYFHHIRSTFIKPSTVSIGFLTVFCLYIAFIYVQSGVWSFSIKVDPVIPTAQEMNLDVLGQKIENSVNPQQTQSDAETESVQIYEKSRSQFWAGITWYRPDFINLLKNLYPMLVGLSRMTLHALCLVALLIIINFFLSSNGRYTPFFVGEHRKRTMIAFLIFMSPALLHMLVSRLFDRLLMQYAIYLLIITAFISICLLKRVLEKLRVENFDPPTILLCLVTLGLFLNFGSPNLIHVINNPHAHRNIRAAGLWLARNRQDAEDAVIIAAKKSTVISFYAKGKTFPENPDKRIVSHSLQEIAENIISEEHSYLVLEPHYLNVTPQLLTFWNEPSLAKEYGLLLVHQDSRDKFQIYTAAPQK